MRSPFRSKYQITQEFGANPDYYKQFGLAGHEGIDLIPSGSTWDVLALEDGVVVLDDDVVGSVSTDPYGKIVTLWHTSINKATMYCHLSENFVNMGQTVKKGDKIGTMGATGNASGAHLHLNLFDVDNNGVRLNRNNGYLGGTNPKPFLEQGDSAPNEQTITISSTLYQSLVTDATHWKDDYPPVSKLLHDNEETNKQKDETIANLIAEGVRLNGEIADLKSANQTLNNKVVYLTEAQRQDSVDDLDLISKNTDLEHKITELNNKIVELTNQKAQPIEPVIDHYEPILEEFWKNLFKGKKTKSISEKIWGWFR